MSDLEDIKADMRLWSITAKKNSLIYGDSLDNGLKAIKELEQQLSNSTPNAAIRELIERLEEEESHHMLFMDERAKMARGGIIALNKLLEGDNNE